MSKSDYKSVLHEKLKDARYAADYLNAVLDEENQAAFLLAIRDVIQANSITMPDIARLADRNEKTLFRTLSDKGNPRFDTLRSILKASGFKISITPDKSRTAKA